MREHARGVSESARKKKRKSARRVAPRARRAPPSAGRLAASARESGRPRGTFQLPAMSGVRIVISDAPVAARACARGSEFSAPGAKPNARAGTASARRACMSASLQGRRVRWLGTDGLLTHSEQAPRRELWRRTWRRS